MSRKKVIGKCHLCGNYGELSFEHIPPRKAFNEKPVIRVSLEQVIGLGPDMQLKGPLQQRGAGDYTLCGKCNSDTGSWYGNAFIDWCYQGFDILMKSNGKPTLIYLFHLFPQRILKQIIAMFASVCSEDFGDCNPELVRFVLNRERKYLSPKYRFFVYYNIVGKFRSAGISASVNINTQKITTLSEVNYPPYGYVFTIDSDPPDQRLIEITHFSHYGYNEYAFRALRFPVLPTHYYLPGDYRTKEEIYKNGVKSEKAMKKPL